MSSNKGAPPAPKRLKARLVGQRGEDAAAVMATQKGWQIHGRNLRLRAGEADLVCVRETAAGLRGLIVEVKSTGDGGYALEARLDAAKRKRLWAMAREIADRLELVEVGVVAVLCVIGADSQQLSWLELDAW